jgi:NHS family xanthosine MFS transporter
MGIKFRLTILNFFQFFVWGAWLITIANFWFGTKNWDGTQFGLVFGTMGIASLFLPTLTGIIADRWLNAEKLYGILHLCYAAVLFYLPQVTTPTNFIYVMLLPCVFICPPLL